MMAVGMYAQGAGLAAIILATFLLNLRHVIMSTCVMNRMHPAPKAAKTAAAGILAWKKAPVMVSVLGTIGAVFVLYLVI